MTVNTKKANRRSLSFASLNDVLADLDAIEAAHSAGTLSTTGNWTPGQILWHCASAFEASIDGFPADIKVPISLRILGKLIKKKATAPGGEAPTGFKIPPNFAAVFQPASDVTFEQGLSKMRDVIKKVVGGTRMEQPSPIFGTMSHEQWTNLHIGHCQMHLSFLHLS